MAAKKTSKKSSKKSSKKGSKKGGSKRKRSTKLSARAETGPVPPYGDPIRQAIARGDVREMRDVAASARKWLTDVQQAVDELEAALQESEG